MKNRSVVKGVARRAVIVRSPDPRMFEEAIFRVREDYANAGGESREEVLRQARRAAGDYLRDTVPPPKTTERWKQWLFIGTAAVGLVLALIIIL